MREEKVVWTVQVNHDEQGTWWCAIETACAMVRCPQVDVELQDAGRRESEEKKKEKTHARLFSPRRSARVFACICLHTHGSAQTGRQYE